MKGGAIIIAPACEKGRGGGHLARSVFLLKALRNSGREAFLWIAPERQEDVYGRLGLFLGKEDHAWIVQGREELKCLSPEFVVLDRYQTPEDEFAFWSGLAPVIGLDEGGPCRGSFDFLVDLLPSISKHAPNLCAPGLLPLPKSRRLSNCAEGRASDNASDSRPLRVLICFGAEDSAGLGYAAAGNLARAAAAIQAGEMGKQAEIVFIAGSMEKSAGNWRMELPGVKVADQVPDLRESLAEYDLLITHFGLTAFEAVYAGVPVLILSPTPYHEKLARNAGFLTVKRGSFNWGKLLDNGFQKTLRQRRDRIARSFGLVDGQREDLGSFINSLAPDAPRICPACRYAHDGGKMAAVGPKAIGRFAGETYRRCPRCGAYWLSRLMPPPIEYEKDYFFGSYKKQYGKTYLEDFPNLKEVGKRRLAHIRSMLAQSSTERTSREETQRLLLDIGCAYGPFMAAAADGGFTPYGIDPAEDAVRYVKEELKFGAWRGFFPDELSVCGSPNGDGAYDAVTLWYAIEHFREPGAALREICRLLKKGGALAFSTPSFSGISGRKNLRSFLQNSPADHFTVWSPRICARILRQHGFRLHKIVVTGHHPERFPLLGRLTRPKKKGPLFKLLLLASRIFRLGDTFEAYATKI